MVEMPRDFLTIQEKNAINFVDSLKSSLDDLRKRGCKVSAETLASARHEELKDESYMRKHNLDDDKVLEECSRLANEINEKRLKMGYEIAIIVVTSPNNNTKLFDGLRESFKSGALGFGGEEERWSNKYEVSNAQRYIARVTGKPATPESVLAATYKFK